MEFKITITNLKNASNNNLKKIYILKRNLIFSYIKSIMYIGIIISLFTYYINVKIVC